MKVFYILALFLGLGTGALAQNAAKLPDWRDIKRALPPEWYGSEQAASIADTLIKYQMTCGGWIKNQNWSGKIKYLVLSILMTGQMLSVLIASISPLA